jgi:ferredoxin
MSKVEILNRDGQTIEVSDGRTVLAGAREANSEWRNYCGGMALCGTCAMIVVEGNPLPPSDIERYFIEGWGYHPNYRLGCQAKVSGDLSVISCADAGFEKERVLDCLKRTEATPSAKIK